MKKVTMQDIADELGISKVTVSKALNDQLGVSEVIRERVRETADRMGYILKSTLKSHEKKHFVFIVPKRYFLETDKFYNVIHYYLNKICMSNEHQLTSIVLNSKEEANSIFPCKIEPDAIDGFFLAGETKDDYLRMISQMGIPMVGIDFYKTFLDMDYILTDNYYMGFLAANYLIERGHSKIGFLGNINQTSSINDRYFGYLKAMNQNGLPVRQDWVISNNDPNTGVYSMEVSLPDELPTAFVCHCDMAAYFMMNSLSLIGKHVPEDVSLISFDNTDLCQTITPSLTSFDINCKEIAEQAFKAMLNSLSGKKRQQRNCISATLVERESVDFRK